MEKLGPKAVDLDVKVKTVKKNLCPIVWDGDEMKPEVREALLKAARKFMEFVNINESSYTVGIVLAGSMANFTYNSKSDFDVHIVVPFLEISDNKDMAHEYFMAKKNIWNNRFNINIKGHPVELYVHDISDNARSNGLFDLKRNDWIKKPEKYHTKPDIISAKKKALDIIEMIDSLLLVRNDEERMKRVEKVWDKIKRMRDIGLDSKNGEISPENIAFKILRNNGYLDKLSKINTKTINRWLTLNEASDKKEEPLGCLMAYFDVPVWELITRTVDVDDLYIDEPNKGIETTPHCTILFGFQNEFVNPKKMMQQVKDLIKMPLEIKVEGVSLFENDKFDVLKFDVIDEKGNLSKLNSFMRQNYPHKNKFNDYKPHVTIGYLKKGMGKKYLDSFNSILPMEMVVEKMVYSEPREISKKKYYWDIGKGMNFVEIQSDLKGMTKEKLSIIKDFISFARQKLDIKRRVFVSLRPERDNIIATTAAYSPVEDKNYIRFNGRSLVDVLRSIGHEMVHNAQREKEIFKLGDKVMNVGGFIEDKANSIAGILIKDFTHNYGYDNVYDF